MVRVGVIGYGYWGPNIVRNFSSVDGSKVVAVCDAKEEVLKKAAKAFPGIRTATSADGTINNKAASGAQTLAGAPACPGDGD